MSFNGTNVIFLEIDDFENNILSYKGKHVTGRWLVMVQGKYCGFCTKSKPHFGRLCKKMGSDEIGKGVIFATIEVDGSKSEQALAKKLPDIAKTNLSGVPAYMLFEDGKFSAMISGAQTENELIEFMDRHFALTGMAAMPATARAEVAYGASLK